MLALAKSTLMQRFVATPCPRWLVLLADLSIIAFAVFLTSCFGLTGYFPLGENIFSPVAKGAFSWLIYALLVMFTGTSRQVIRLSVIEDTYRLILLVLSAVGVQVFVSITTYIFFNFAYFQPWSIFITALLVFTMLLFLRVVVKMVFISVSAVTRERKKVIMLGSAINSFYMASALKAEFDGLYEPVALLSLTRNGHDMKVNGIPIVPYDPENVSEVFRQFNCNTLMFLSTQIETMRSGMADVFLREGVHLMMLNQVEEFDINNQTHMSNLSGHVHNIKIEDLLGRESIDTHNPAIEQVVRDQVLMVTGAAGSIGSEIVRQLARLQARELILVDQAETPMHELQLEMQSKFPNVRIHLFVGDITNLRRMERAFFKYHPRYVFHAAAYKHVPMMERNPTEAVHTNVFGTKNIADLSMKYGVEKFVMVSTDKAVNPTNVMGASKRIAEIYVQSLNTWLRANSDGPVTKFITTRFGNVLGSNGSVIPLFRKQIEEGGPVTITHRDIIRYFMTIPEACNLVLEAGVMGRGGEIFIFDMGEPVKIMDLACKMISLSGLRPGVDIEIKETGLRPGEKLYEELLNEKEHTTATHHPKIMIARVREYDYHDICTSLETLEELVDGPAHDIVAQMKHIVVEYKSNNSEWQSVDKEITAENGEHPQIHEITSTPLPV